MCEHKRPTWATHWDCSCLLAFGRNAPLGARNWSNDVKWNGTFWYFFVSRFFKKWMALNRTGASYGMREWSIIIIHSHPIPPFPSIPCEAPVRNSSTLAGPGGMSHAETIISRWTQGIPPPFHPPMGISPETQSAQLCYVMFTKFLYKLGHHYHPVKYHG